MKYFKVMNGYKEKDVISNKEYKLILVLEDESELSISYNQQGELQLRKTNMIIKPVVSNVIEIL